MEEDDDDDDDDYDELQCIVPDGRYVQGDAG
jgi:hypothetical protein